MSTKAVGKLNKNYHYNNQELRLHIKKQNEKRLRLLRLRKHLQAHNHVVRTISHTTRI